MQKYYFPNLEFRIKEAKNNIPKCTVQDTCYPDLTQIQLSLLALYALQKNQQFSLSQYYKYLISRSSKLVSHNLLELQKERFPRCIPLHRKVSYVWNAAFGILGSAVSYKQ
jgi:hypothetical protein